MSLWNVIFEQNGTPEKWVRNVTCTEEMALLKVSQKLEHVICIEAMSLFLVLLKMGLARPFIARRPCRWERTCARPLRWQVLGGEAGVQQLPRPFLSGRPSCSAQRWWGLRLMPAGQVEVLQAAIFQAARGPPVLA